MTQGYVDTMASANRHGFWAGRLAQHDAMAFPYAVRAAADAAVDMRATPWVDSPALLTLDAQERTDWVVTAWAVYLRRLDSGSGSQLGWHDDRSCGAPGSLLPMQVDFASDTTLDEARRKIDLERTMLADHLPLSIEDKRLAPHFAGRWVLGAIVSADTSDSALPAHASLLTLQVTPQNGSYRWIYDHARIAPSTLEQMEAHLETLLAVAGSVHGRELAACQIDLLSPAEYDLLNRWNRTEALPVPVPCIHRLFEVQCRAIPDRDAVIDAAGAITYEQLNLAANRLASHLRTNGVRVGDRVALCAGRSSAMVAALLGIMKAGAAYVPLDPAYPSERLAQVLEDAAPDIVLMDAAGRGALSEAATRGRHCIVSDGLDRLAPWPGACDSDPCAGEIPVSGSDIAYVIYTSGTTGRPKGTEVEHRSAANFWQAMCETTHRDCPAHAVVALNASVSFDMSLKGLLQLLSGHTLVLIPERLRGSGDDLLDFLAERGVHAFDSTPSQLENLIGAGMLDRTDYRPLSVLLGGEAIQQRMWDQLRTSSIRFFNMYGPTEATVDATIGRVSELGVQPSIGRAIRNVRIHLLDRAGLPVPPGAVGEIHISGEGLARCYLGQAALTAERFPFGRVEGPGTPAVRMYRTGDLARHLGDGSLEFLGRNDRQVKIRGFRIEPDDVAACLAKHPAVREATVMAREADDNELRLVAYVVAHAVEVGQEKQLCAEFRQFLSDRLPDYMVPAAVMVLAAMPLTSNGKLDRRALPAPDTWATTSYRAPETAREAALCALFAEVLSIPRIGLDDHFFELGGHSLMAIRMIARIRRELSVELPIKALFQNPTPGALARRLDSAAAARPPLERLPRPAVLPLSFAQQRLWFLDRLEGPAATYNAPLVIRLQGEVDADALSAALTDLCVRHESLRTVFADQGGMPRQRILAANEAFPSLSLRETWTEEDLQHEIDHPFDLGQALPIRATLWKEDRDSHILSLVLHHIACDGGSLAALTHDLSTAYAARCRGDSPAWPELAVQYADYTLWQRRWLGDADDTESLLAQQFHYWHQALAGLPDQINLPSDRPRPAVREREGRYLRFGIGSGLHERLHELARVHGVTLSMALQAALATLLHRLGSGDDIPLGCVTAGREDQALNDLIGFFANTWVLRVDLSDNPTFATVLARVRERALDAYTHQDAPFERLVELLNPSRSASHHPLFQVSLVLQHHAPPALDLPGIRADILQTRTRTARFDLFFNLFERRGPGGQWTGIDGGIEYACDMFDPTTVQQLADRFVRLLERVSEDASKPVHAFDLLDSGERDRLLYGWNATDTDYPSDLCIHQLFEQQVRRTPDAVAVQCGDETVTYGELNRRANRLAHVLVELGITPDARIALCMERSLALVVALFAVLKAGGAYVPLDPGHSKQRLAELLDDTAPSQVLVDAAGSVSLAGALPAGAILIDPDGRSPACEVAPDHDPDAGTLGLTVRHLAYVIYTSGSTGMPKGAQNEHRAVVNRLCWMQDAYPLDASDAVLQKTPYSFDVSVWEFFWPLLCGARMVVAPPGLHRDPRQLAKLIVDTGITTIHFVPSMLSSFLDAADAARCTSLRRIMCSGEALPVASARRCLRLLPSAELHNLYGPTEAAIDVTAWHCSPGFEGDTVPIGKPIANTRVYLLDAHGQPVPQGTPGELYIGGIAVARGYHRRPELTAERFLADPFSAEPSASMYRTGDIARYRTNGDIEYLGRNDHQVKIRGFRIEPGEIETRLGEHALVRENAVVSREDLPGETRLVAYVVLAADDPVAGSGWIDILREHLRQSLPEHMWPSAFVELRSLPLTPNGKLDRKALPAPGEDAYGCRPYEAPRGPTETAIASIWQSLLDLQRVGRQDPFFDVGGHSLLAVRLLSRIAEATGVEVKLAAFFARPTVAALAEAVDGSSRCSPPGLVALDRAGRLPLSPSQRRLWFLAQLDTDDTTYHMPMALRMRGRLDETAWLSALKALFARHEALRMTFGQHDGEPYARLLAADAFAPEHVDLRSHVDIDEQLEACRRDEAAKPFDLQRGPLLRATLIRLGDTEWACLLTMHHIVSDQWSLEIFYRELETLYRSFSGHVSSALEPLALHYIDYIAQQLHRASTYPLDAERMYWRKQLDAAPALIDLPLDRARPEHPSHRGARLPLSLDPALVDGIRRLARRLHATPYMVVLAAWSAVLSRLTGQHEIVVGSPVAGRHHAGAESLMGFFVNSVALRIDLSGTPDALSLIAQARDTVLAAQDHQALSFEQVVDALQPPRRLDHTPIFQVLLAWSTDSGHAMTLPDLDVEFLPSAYERIKFDLELHLGDRGDCIEGDFNYAIDLFDEATIARHRGYLLTLLHAMVVEPCTPLAEVDMLGATEREQLLVEWNRTDAPHDRTLCIHQWFARQATLTPESTALVHGNDRLSYAQLDAASNRLAHRLIAAGARPEARIALCMRRGIRTVVAMLGVLKAGAAYVPLDIAAPQARLADIIQDAAPLCMIVDDIGRDALGPASSYSSICLDGETLGGSLDGAAWPSTAPRIEGLTPANLAYVIYTSGSTGVPKGVMIEHAQTINLLAWAHRSFQPGQSAATLFSTPIHFDLSIFECFVPLTRGDAVVVVNNVLDLIENSYPLSLVNTVPSAMRPLLDACAIPVAVDTVNLAGEPLKAALIDDIFERSGVTRINNLYGPSETTTYSTWISMERGKRVLESIGRPIDNTRIYLLDPQGMPVPLGSIGEIHIGGAGVSRGYLNRPELTRERFLPDPFSDVPGARMYRTGDLARYRADGNLSYLGRNDYQVKLRGFRIELGDIETMLMAHPAVREAVVVALGSGSDDMRLVAYVTPLQTEDGSIDWPSELKACLSARLPEYMVPQGYVVLDRLPLNRNGKIDRSALPPPGMQAFARSAGEPPEGDIEIGLARLWMELLSVDCVNRQDHFFQLGGNSLLAMRLIGRIQSTWGVSISIRTMFTQPSLAALAETILVALVCEV